MSWLAMIIWVAVLGVLAWVVSTQVPWIHPTFRQIIVIVLIVLALIIVANGFGLLAILHSSVPRV